MQTGTRTYRVKISFLWDDGSDEKIFLITVPNTTSLQTVEEEVRKMHEYLCSSEGDIYGATGRNPDTLMEQLQEYTCWQIEEEMPADLEIELL